MAYSPHGKFEPKLIGLYKGDYAKLARIQPNNPPGVVVRVLVREYIERVERQLNEIMEPSNAS